MRGPNNGTGNQPETSATEADRSFFFFFSSWCLVGGADGVVFVEWSVALRMDWIPPWLSHSFNSLIV